MPKNCFAIVPAAGHSRRMRGKSKLLLPWKGETVIDHVLRTWSESRVSRVVVVVRSEDSNLQKVCRKWSSVDVLTPEEDPPDMKKSIRFGLHFLAATVRPDSEDRWLVAPADLPTLTTELINQVIEASQTSDRIVAPKFGERPGHPISLPWSMVPHVDALGPDQGLNQLIAEHSVQWISLPPEQRPEDVDTSADYERLSRNRGE